MPKRILGQAAVQRRGTATRWIGWFPGCRQLQNCDAVLGSHCSNRTIDGSLLAPLMNSSSDNLPRTISNTDKKVSRSGILTKLGGRPQKIYNVAIINTKHSSLSHGEKNKLLKHVPILPSLFVSICRKIFSVRFSGVDSSSGIFITEETIL